VRRAQEAAGLAKGAKKNLSRGRKKNAGREDEQIVATGEGKKRRIEKTAEGHHLLIDGRRWRAIDPGIPKERRQQLVNKLMRARRVGRALARE
jgi:hypothetical protein